MRQEEQPHIDPFAVRPRESRWAKVRKWTGWLIEAVFNAWP